MCGCGVEIYIIYEVCDIEKLCFSWDIFVMFDKSKFKSCWKKIFLYFRLYGIIIKVIEDEFII